MRSFRPVVARERARLALADRFTRLSPGDLRERLRHEDDEVRRAAAAALRKKDGAPAPELARLAEDDDPAVAAAARRALEKLTGRKADAAATKKRR